MVEVEGPDGRRDVALEDFHPLPGDHPERESALAPGELVVALRLPPAGSAFRAHARYLKLRERTSFAFALVSAAAALDLDGGRIRAARIALGGVAARPWRARAAEAALAGAAPDAESLRAAPPPRPLAGARPSGDNAWKIALAERIVARALAAAAAGTPARMPDLPGSVLADPLPSGTGARPHA